VLAQGVELDVVGGGTQDVRVVFELTESAVAVEAQQCSHPAGLVVMVDVDRRRHRADGTEPLLLVEQVVRLRGRDPVSPGEVVAARSADLFA
jgi:hypothetical protein